MSIHCTTSSNRGDTDYRTKRSRSVQSGEAEGGLRGLAVVPHRHVRDNLLQGDLLLCIRLVLPIGLLKLDLQLLDLASSCRVKQCGQGVDMMNDDWQQKKALAH
jgi:hypothetical protein